MDRFKSIDGVHNFRDFGGYKTVSGRKVKNGKLFRAGQFSNLSDNGRASLNQISPKLVVDLRRINEREEQPSGFGDLKLRKIAGDPQFDNAEGLPPHLSYLRDGDISFDKTFSHMIDTYARMPNADEYKYIFRETFAALAQEESPIIIHCAAGKDRTGVLCALILHSLEVDEATILDDFLLTNKIPYLDKIIAGYAAKLSERFNRTFDPKDTWPMGAVYEEYLQTAMKIIKDDYGGVMPYLNEIGVDDEMIAKVRGHLIE